jgi:hypothetical protein
MELSPLGGVGRAAGPSTLRRHGWVVAGARGDRAASGAGGGDAVDRAEAEPAIEQWAEPDATAGGPARLPEDGEKAGLFLWSTSTSHLAT